MKQNRRIIRQVLLAFCVLITAVARSQNASLVIDGEVTKSLKVALGDLRKMKSTALNAKDRDGKEHVYKGVILATLLDSAGVTLGGKLRGENLTKFILARAADGYEVTYSLAEVDPELSSRTVLLAYEVDGKPLPSGEGPFRLVAEGDKRPARWIRELVSISVLYPK